MDETVYMHENIRVTVGGEIYRTITAWLLLSLYFGHDIMCKWKKSMCKKVNT